MSTWNAAEMDEAARNNRTVSRSFPWVHRARLTRLFAGPASVPQSLGRFPSSLPAQRQQQRSH